MARQQFQQFEAHAKVAAEGRGVEIAARLTRMVPANLVKQYDTNGNGLIDPDEWLKYRQDIRQRTAALSQPSGSASSNTSATPAATTPTKP